MEFLSYKTEFKTQYFQLSNDELIGYREWSNAPYTGRKKKVCSTNTVLLIHGHMASSLVFEPLMKAFRDFYKGDARPIRLVAPCLKGMGYSSFVNC